MGTLDLNISFTTQTTTIPNNKSVTLAPTTTKKFHVPSVLVLEPKPIGPTPSLIIKNNNQQVVSMTGGTATITTPRINEFPPRHSVVGWYPQKCRMRSFKRLHKPLRRIIQRINANADLEDWTKGVVYEGVDIDICGSSHHDLLNQNQHQSTRTQHQEYPTN